MYAGQEMAMGKKEQDEKAGRNAMRSRFGIYI